MSQTTVHQCANDLDIQKRVQSCVYGEAFNNAAFKNTIFAIQVRQGYANFTPIYFAVAVAVEAKYESGILNGRGSPGHDRDVITDNDILAAVQAEWPMEEPPPTATPSAAPPPPTST